MLEGIHSEHAVKQCSHRHTVTAPNSGITRWDSAFDNSTKRDKGHRKICQISIFHLADGAHCPSEGYPPTQPHPSCHLNPLFPCPPRLAPPPAISPTTPKSPPCTHRVAMAGCPSRPSKMSQYKLVLLGETSVGKSSLLLQFVKGQYQDSGESTIGAAFLTQLVSVDGAMVKFEIWDTAGQERYHSLAPMYYRGAQASIVVYDITNTETFVRAKAWVSELQKQASKNMVIALVGNKADRSANRVVDYTDGQGFAADNSLLFMETSAKTAMNVNNLFLSIAKKLPKIEQLSGVAGIAGVRGGPPVDLRPPVQSSPAQCCGN
ncbi:hypothetical protein UPYG_G00168000 [Umbra pygmaea]|uniref:Rab5 n=1 Tax=Umbra pygmaea TaxID=75934 RepID=A0ABD0X6Y4_UMBPY